MALNPPLVYDPRHHSFVSWASLMVELYAAQSLEIPSSEDSWKAWATGLKGIDTFANEAIPDPYAFEYWSEWAEALVSAVNPRPQ